MAVGDLEYTEFSCSGCGGDIAAGSTEHLELLLFEDPDGRRALLKYAHSRCAKSEIQVRRFPPLPGHLDTAFTPGLARLGSARLGTARLGTARLGSARLAGLSLGDEVVAGSINLIFSI